MNNRKRRSPSKALQLAQETRRYARQATGRFCLAYAAWGSHRGRTTRLRTVRRVAA